jgi:HEPN domain-containing protein
MKTLTREWVRKAEADYVMASALSRLVPPVHDGVCFHCQQCAEKYLKLLWLPLCLPVTDGP